jgi:hypothetical protein
MRLEKLTLIKLRLFVVAAVTAGFACFFAIISISLLAVPYAAATEVELNTKELRSSFVAGLQMANFKLPTGKLSGYGLSLGADLALTQSIAGQAYFTQVFGAAPATSSSGVQTICTGFQLGVAYVLLGAQGSKIETVDLNGRALVEVQKPRRWNLKIGAGYDQFWLNGTESIYPASGFAYFISGEVPVGSSNIWIKPSYRISSLAVSNGSQIDLSAAMLAFDIRF